MASETDNTKEWDDFASMSTDAIKKLIDDALKVLKKRETAKSDERPASELSDAELRDRVERQINRKG